MATNGPKMVEIRDRSDEELMASLTRAKEELFRLRVSKMTNQLPKPIVVREKRREIARIMTVISDRTNASASAETKR